MPNHWSTSPSTLYRRSLTTVSITFHKPFWTTTHGFAAKERLPYTVHKWPLQPESVVQVTTRQLATNFLSNQFSSQLSVFIKTQHIHVIRNRCRLPSTQQIYFVLLSWQKLYPIAGRCQWDANGGTYLLSWSSAIIADLTNSVHFLMLSTHIQPWRIIFSKLTFHLATRPNQYWSLLCFTVNVQDCFLCLKYVFHRFSDSFIGWTTGLVNLEKMWINIDVFFLLLSCSCPGVTSMPEEWCYISI